MKSDEILEIIVKPNLKREFKKYVEEEGYEILEEIREKAEIRFRINLKTKKQIEEKKREILTKIC